MSTLYARPSKKTALSNARQRNAAKKTNHDSPKKKSHFYSDFESEFNELWKQIQPYTLTSPERAYGLFKGIEYLVSNGIEGDFVECGVYRGGSSMLAALSLKYFGTTKPELWLYDTYEGMPEPGKEDVIAHSGQHVGERWTEGWWKAALDEVTRNMESTKYPAKRIHYVKGDVAETLLETKPASIAMLRLDTDWYKSTKIELELLYPLLVPGGMLIIDDYGHFSGAKKAVDEYFAKSTPFLHRLDYTGRLIIKSA